MAILQGTEIEPVDNKELISEAEEPAFYPESTLPLSLMKLYCFQLGVQDK